MYKAVIDLKIEVHEVKNGKCQGTILPDSEMQKVGLKNNLLISIDGVTKNDCLTKLKEWLNEYT